MQESRQIRQHKGFRILGTDDIAALFGEIGLMTFFVDGKQQFLLFPVKVHFFLIPVQIQFRLVHQPEVFGIFQQFQQILGFRLAGFDPKQQPANFVFQRRAVRHVGTVGRVQFLQQRPGLGQKPAAEPFLRADERLDRRPPLRVLLVISVQGRAADDERRARLVDEDGVHLIHNGKMMPALDLVLLAHRHAVVAQIIETELGVRAIGDVAVILLAAKGRRLVMQDAADGEAEKFVNRAHPFRVARRQVIVHRHHMDAAAGQRIEINRHGGHERFAFAGGHFGDLPRVQRHAANELDVERNHLPHHGMAAHHHFRLALGQAAAGIFDDGERLGQNFVERSRQFLLILNGRQARFPIGGFLA